MEEVETLDITGLRCPLTWVKTKMKLEELSNGEQLLVLIDPGEPIENLPRSVKDEGHRIMKLTREGERYLVLIEKGRLTT